MVRHLQPLIDALAGRQLILHAGSPKTGSTALQCWLDQHRQQLLVHGILYPSNVSDPVKPKHQWLLEGLRPGHEEIFYKQAELIAEELNRQGAESVNSVLLSTEGLYNHFEDVVAPQKEELVHLVSQCATKLVLVVRNPLEFSLSRYRQNIINPPSTHPYHGTPKSIDELCNDPLWLKALDYLSFVSFWEELIGRDRIHCLPYSQVSASNFCRLLRIEPPDSDNELPQRNISAGLIGVELIRSLNQLQLRPEHRQQVIKHIRLAEDVLPQPLYRFEHSPTSSAAVRAYCEVRHRGLVARYPALTRDLDCEEDGGSAMGFDLAFICCIQPGFLEEQVITLVQSIRLFGGALRNQPVYVISPWGEAINSRTSMTLEALEAHLIIVNLNQKLRDFPYANKAYALEYMEQEPGHAIHVFLDSDTLVVDEPMALAIDSEADFAARPVDLRGICSSPNDHFYRDYWESCCRLFDVDLQKLPVIQSTVDKQAIHTNWNGGLLTMRGNRGVGKRWREVLETLWEQQLCARPRNFWGSGQVAFTIATESLNLKRKILGEEYNIPLHLNPEDVGIANIAKPVHLHYHWMQEASYRREWSSIMSHLKLKSKVKDYISRIPSFKNKRGKNHTGFKSSTPEGQ